MAAQRTPTSPPLASPYSAYSAYANFNLGALSSSGSDDDDDNDDDDADELPFPTALSRKDFLAPAFDPTAYLSSLFPSEDGSTSAQRHQTLEDLRTELRERSSAISAELLELVNSNYTSFLGLGDELRGGDEKVEDVRVALFGFRRSIEDVQRRVQERRVAVTQGCSELGEVRTSIHQGRRLLELDDRVALLEDRLNIGVGSSNNINNDSSAGGDPAELWDLEETDEEDENDEDPNHGTTTTTTYVGSGPAKLMSIARDLVLANKLADSVGRHVPFVRKVEERLAKCRNTLLMDLNSAVKEVRRVTSTASAQARLLKLLAVYRVLDADNEAVRLLSEKS